MALLDELSTYAVTEATQCDSAEVIHFAKRVFLDWLASIYPGTTLPPVPQLVTAYQDELGRGSSSVPGFKTTAFPATAAWINGTASHVAEYDDIYREGIFHPGSPTISAALAIAESLNLSGKAFLKSIIVGYEISTRIGAAVQPSHLRYFHATGTLGSIGAGAAAAVLLAPRDALVIRHAIATATTFASGLQQALRSDAMTKAIHSGHAAAVGVRSAQAAAQGVTGAIDILEGDVGFGAAMAESPNWNIATQGLGTEYNISRITHKIHACCGHQFPAIDAALALRSRYDLTPDMIGSIRLQTYSAAIEATGRFNPASVYEAKFSLPYVLSHALIHGSVRLDAFTRERLKSTDIRALMSRIKLEPDREMSALFPQKRVAILTINTLDGRQLIHEIHHRRGDPESPLSDQDLNAKFDDNCAPILGSQAAMALRDRVWHLDNIDVRELSLASI